MTPEGWSIIIGALGVVAVNLVTAWRAERKLDVIHVLTNSTLTGVRAELDIALKRITQLEELYTSMVGPPPPPPPKAVLP